MSENPMLYAGVGEPITGNKKKLCPGNVKKSARFSGNPGKSEEIRYLNLYEPMIWQF